jgi:hypothetical protein
MNIAKILTPKDTEEIKQGLFIQKTSKGYRQITPAAWNGIVNWKVVIFGSNSLKNFLFFCLLMFLAWSYQHDTKGLLEWQNYVLNDTEGFCKNMSIIESRNNAVAFNPSLIDPIINLNGSADSLQNIR